MDQTLKILTAIALVAVIIASAVIIIDHVKHKEPKAEPQPPASQPGTSTPAQSQPSAPQPGANTLAPSNTSSYRPDKRAIPQFSNALEVATSPIQPTYRPINQPTYLQMLRQEGKTYHSIVMGKLSGRASKTDWGLQGTAFFNYLYGLDSTGKILKNDGMTIIEERNFTKVQEELLVSGYEVGIDLGDRIRSLADSVGLSSLTETIDGRKITIKKGWVDAARKLGIFQEIPQVDPEKFERDLRMFSAGTNDRLLEGKTVRITFVDGQGITLIKPVNCAISEKERDVIIRSNFALDHYVFPDRQVSPGEEWDIDGDVLGGFLDPRISGKAGGKVTILRTPDFSAADGAISKKLKISRGTIVVHDVGTTNAVTGQLTSLSGVLMIPDAVHVVTSASLKGYADYQNVSTDHLLFEAKHTVKPKFEIQYNCTVQ
ncbi:MAG: hypothetical protein WCT12_06525 [Verrucomicrobiota bacterium]